MSVFGGKRRAEGTMGHDVLLFFFFHHAAGQGILLYTKLASL